MTRNADNYHIIRMGPFKGLNRNADEQDVPGEYFVDGENMVCTDKPGEVVTRPGCGHWMVDENGYGVPFSQPFAILAGGSNVGGTITPPSAVPIGGTPSVLVNLNEDPPTPPTSGPIAQTPTPDDSTEQGEDIPTPPTPVGGGITLAKSPTNGLFVDIGTNATASFAVTEDLPSGVTIASYAWDYVWYDGTPIGADASGASKTQTKIYSTSDPVDFLAAVKGTGSDGVTYWDAIPVHLTHKESALPDGMIRFSQPEEGIAQAADQNFTITIDYLEKDATGDYVLTSTGYDVTITQVGGTAQFLDAGGSVLAGGGKTIAFTAESQNSTSVQATLESGASEGSLILQARQEYTGFTAQRIISIGTSKFLVEVVDASGNALTEQDFTMSNGSLTWVHYLRVTAQDENDATVTAFADLVKLIGSMTLENSSWDKADGLSITFTGYDENSTYSAATATTGSWLGEVTIPVATWAAGDAGIITVKVEIEKLGAIQDVYDPSENPNAGYAQMAYLAADLSPGSLYGCILDSIDLYGANYLTVDAPSTVYADTDTTLTVTAKDATGTDYTGYNGETCRVRCYDSDGTLIQCAVGGGAYADYADLTMSNQTGSTSTLQVDCSANAGNQIYITAEILSGGNSLTPKVYGNDSATAATAVSKLAFTVEPSGVTRDSNFSITLQAQDGYGNKLSGVTDAFTITLTGSDANDKFTSPDPDNTVISGSFTDGEWSTTTEQITGGSGTDTGVTLVAAATGYTGATSSAFSVYDPITVTVHGFEGSAFYPSDTWANARSNCDGDAAGSGSYDDQGYLYRFASGTSSYVIRRGGRKVTGVDGQTSLTVSWEKGAVWNLDATYDFYVRYSHTAPTNGQDYRTGGTLLTTISVSVGEDGDTGSFDGSAAINGTDDIYIWAVPKADVDNSFPDWSSKTQFAQLKITNITMS